MNPIDNTNLINYCRSNCDVASFSPKVSFVYDAAIKTVEATDGSTFGAGDGLKIVHVRALDQFGGEVRGTITITGAAGKQTLDVSTLNSSKGINVTATILTNTGFVADGSFFNIGPAGDLSRWDKQ